MSETLVKAIQYGAASLIKGVDWANPLGLLGALAEVESSFGEANRARFEKIYSWGNRYFSAEQMDRWHRWGDIACCSYSSFQIMYPTACELGFDHSPWDRNPTELFDDQVAILFVLAFIQKRMVGVHTVGDFADAWNTGSFKDSNVPHEYIVKFTQSYQTVVQRRGLTLGKA
jgi:hypothetical protein